MHLVGLLYSILQTSKYWYGTYVSYQ